MKQQEVEAYAPPLWHLHLPEGETPSSLTKDIELWPSRARLVFQWTRQGPHSLTHMLKGATQAAAETTLAAVFPTLQQYASTPTQRMASTPGYAEMPSAGVGPIVPPERRCAGEGEQPRQA